MENIYGYFIEQQSEIIKKKENKYSKNATILTRLIVILLNIYLQLEFMIKNDMLITH